MVFVAHQKAAIIAIQPIPARDQERIASEEEWPEFLDQRLQSISILLANSLASELDRKRLLDELDDQKEQISLMVHQLRNPLAALGTYAKLLLRKIGPESEHENLVKGLITEQAQVNKYLSALDQLSQVKLPQADDGSNRLLLPPLLPTETYISVKSLIDPLIDRAKARANLQGRKWLVHLNGQRGWNQDQFQKVLLLK